MTKFSAGKSGKIIDLRNKKPTITHAPNHKSASNRSVSQIQPRRTSPLRSHRRKIRVIALGVSVVLIVAGGIGVHMLSAIPALTIQKVEVHGAAQISSESVRDFVQQSVRRTGFQYIARNNIFFYPQKSIEGMIVFNFPHVKSADLSRESIFSTTLSVSIAEREPFARWCPFRAAEFEAEVPRNDCYLMDDSGFIFAAANESSPRPKQAYIFEGDIEGGPIGETYKPGNLPGLLGLLRLLENGGYRPHGVKIVDDRDFQVPLASGFYIKGSFGGHPDVMVKNLQLLLLSEYLRGKEESIEYIDLRFGNRVYYKLKGEAEVEPEQN